MDFSAKHVMEKCRKQHRYRYVAFIDLVKEFASVDRCLFWKILENCASPPKNIDIMQQLHNGMSVRDKISGDL